MGYKEEGTSLVVVGYFLSFFLSFGVGGNNVANTFGTVVASKSVPNNGYQRIIGVLFEMLGAFLTYFFMTNAYEKKGLIDYSQCSGSEGSLISGSVATMAATCIWLLGGTFCGYPVSVTHCLLGSALGASYFINCIQIQRQRVFYLYVWTLLVPVFCGALSVALLSTLKYSSIKAEMLDKKFKNIKKLSKYGLILFIGVVIFVYIFLEPPDTLLYFVHRPILDSRLGWFVGLFFMFLIAPTYLYYRFCLLSSFEGSLADHLPNIFHFRRVLQFFKKVPVKFFRVISSEEKNVYRVRDSQGVRVGGDGMDRRGSREVTPGAETQNTSEVDDEERYSCFEFLVEKRENNYDIKKSDNVSINQCMPHGENEETSVKSVEEPINQVQESSSDASPPQLDTSQDSSSEKENPRYRRSPTYQRLLVVTTIASCVGRGGHDVSNAISPLFVLVTVRNLGMSSIASRSDVPIDILVLGLFGIVLGMLTWWKPVMRTVSKKLVKPVTHFSGFCIEFGLLLTMVVCSQFDVAITMTYCKVVTMAAVGYMEATINIRLLKEITFIWFLTVPGTFLLGLIFYEVLQ